MTQIEQLVIRRFKQLQEFELNVSETTLLIGANNSGKSSVLQALHFAVSVAQTAKLVGEGVNWSTDKFQLSYNPAQLIYTPVADVLSLASGGVLQEAPGSQIEVEISTSDGEKCKVTVRRGRNRNIQVSIEGRKLGERLMNMEKLFTVYAPGLAGIPKDERYMSPGVVRRIVARGDANLVLRNVIRMLSLDKPSWNSFLEDMRSLFSGIKIEIEFDEQRDETIAVFFQTPGGPRLPIDAAGTSILQASQILAYISLFQPTVLILDEPDSHLHANNQRVLCNLVIDLSTKRGFRALISTHSRHVLDAMRNRSTVVWMNKGQKFPYDSLTTASQLLELGALDSIDYFADGEIRCLLATEDSSTESIEALRVLLECNNFIAADTEIRSYSGCTKIDSAKVLAGFLTEKAPHIRFVLHRDRDYMDDVAAQKFEEEITEMGAFPFLTTFSDIEGYFINAAHLSHLNPPLTVERVQELIDEATNSTRDKSIEKMINIRHEIANRNRNGGSSPNAGAIAIQAASDFDKEPSKWRRGKIVLSQLRSLLQSELSKNPTVIDVSPHLKLPRLATIQEAIWPVAK